MTAPRKNQDDEVMLKAFGIQLSGKGRLGVLAASAISLLCVATYLIIKILI